MVRRSGRWCSIAGRLPLAAAAAVAVALSACTSAVTGSGSAKAAHSPPTGSLGSAPGGSTKTHSAGSSSSSPSAGAVTAAARQMASEDGITDPAVVERHYVRPLRQLMTCPNIGTLQALSAALRRGAAAERSNRYELLAALVDDGLPADCANVVDRYIAVTNGGGRWPADANGGGSPTTSGSTRPSPSVTRVDGTVSFSSPTRNIGCSLDAHGARCDIAHRDYRPPHKPADCSLAWGSSIELAAGRAHLLCAGDTVLGASTVLAYGHGLQAGNVRCVSRFEGMQCQDLATGSGFTLARERYSLH